MRACASSCLGPHMQRRTVLERGYIFEYDVGRWSFGTVQVLRHTDTQLLRTCKTVPKSSVVDKPSHVMAKLNTLKELQHNHVSCVVEVLEDESNFYIFNDVTPGADVADWMQRMDDVNWLQEQTCAAYIRQVLLALAHSHNRGVFHQDLRPSSLLLTSKLPDASVKVGGLGLADILDPDHAISQRTQNAFIAPEVLMGSEPIQNGSADIWSVGAIAHALLLGRTPSESNGGMNSGWNLARRVKVEDEEGWSERSSLSRDFVQRLLRPDGERPTAAKALQHPWIKGLLPIGGVHLRADNDLAREARHKTLCYTLAVLLVPVMVPYRDFEQLRVAFNQSDSDHDGYISRGASQRLLLTRCSLREAVDAAVDIADVGKEEVVDLCAAAAADVIAREFFAAGPTGAPLAGPLRATDLAPRMLKRFFEVFGDRKEPRSSAQSIRSKLRTATARDFEAFAGVRYDSIIACLPEDQPIDSQVLASELTVNAGEGTPLRGCELPPLVEKSPWSASLLEFPSFFASCGAGSRDASPHSMRLH